MHLEPVTKPAYAQSDDWISYDQSWTAIMAFIFLSILVPRKLF